MTNVSGEGDAKKRKTKIEQVDSKRAKHAGRVRGGQVMQTIVVGRTVGGDEIIGLET